MLTTLLGSSDLHRLSARERMLSLPSGGDGGVGGFLQNCLVLTKCQEPSPQSLLPKTYVLSLLLKTSPSPQG